MSITLGWTKVVLMMTLTTTEFHTTLRLSGGSAGLRLQATPPDEGSAATRAPDEGTATDDATTIISVNGESTATDGRSKTSSRIRSSTGCSS